MTNLIYGLFDSSIIGPPHIRYVGYTTRSLEVRLNSHLIEVGKRVTCHRHKWIRSLLRRGIKPSILLLEIVTIKNWQERERFWISRLRHLNLTNATDGGEGLINPSPEIRKRISIRVSQCLIGNQRRKGIKHDEASRAAMRRGQRSEKAQARNLSRKGKPGTTTNRHWINNGVKRRLILKHEPLPVGWYLGYRQR